MAGTPVATLAEAVLRRMGVAVVPVALRPTLTTTLTADTIATRALMQLSVIAADETPAALDQALALAKVSAVHDAIVAQGFVSWDSASIPQAVAEEYTMLTALHLASAFGKQGDPAQQPVLESRVRKVAALLNAVDVVTTSVTSLQKDPTMMPLRFVAIDSATDAVMDVHRIYAARGLIRWTVFDIPAAAEDAYVMAAASALAPEFGVPSIKGDDVEAARKFAQIIALPSSGEHVRGEYF